MVGHSGGVQTVSLSWQHAEQAAAVLLAAGAGLALSRSARVRAVGAAARELAIIGALYGLWQLAGRLAHTPSGVDSALARARWIERFEHWLPLPPERSVQGAALHAPLLVQGANLYYAAMHLTTMLVFLVWLFVRHRSSYRPVRQVMAWTTLGCVLVQFVPVAPPRMLPGFVDTGLLFGQSVYSNGLPVDQLAAMPSIHVAWAVLVGWYVWRVSPSRWRFVGPLHAVVTVLVVVLTGNHWWLDGIVGVAILVACAWAVSGVRAAWRAAVAARRGVPVLVPEPLAEPV